MDAPLPANLCDAWAAFLSEPRHWSDVYADSLLFPLQRKREQAAMLELAASINPRVVCEVGADKGGSFFGWCSLPTVKLAIAVEIRGVPYVDLFRGAFPAVDVVGIGAGSTDQETLEQIRWTLRGQPIDVLFLDGDKAQFDRDFDVYRPLMRSGGVVFMHDVQDDIPPRRAFLALAERYETDTILDVTEGEEAIARKTAGVAPRNGYEQWLDIWATTSCGVGVVRIP